MPRKPGVWPYQGFWRTSALGVPKEKLCPLTDGKEKAEAILRERISANATPAASTPTNKGETPGEPGRVRTVREAAEAFLAHCRSEKSTGTADWYSNKLADFLVSFGSFPLSSLTPEKGIEYKKKLQDKGLKNSTINMTLRAVKGFLRWTTSPVRRWLPTNPWSELATLDEKGRERLITREEFSSLLSVCTPGNCREGREDFQELLTMLRYTTMRPGEVRLLRWEYWKPEKSALIFPAAVIKTRSRRRVSLSDELTKLLSERRQRFATRAGWAPGYVFSVPGKFAGKRVASMGTKPLSANVLRKRFSLLLKRASDRGLVELEKDGERLVLYTTRHTRITELAKANLPTVVLMEEAGHKNFQTTKRYIHDFEDHVTDRVREAMKEIDQ